MLLEAKNICKSFHDKQVLHNIDFTLEKGEICGLVGKNGAGKSTFSNIICGLLKEDSGQIRFEGETIDKETVLQRQERGIFMVPQHSTIVMDFTVTENLFVGKWMKKKGVIDSRKMEETAARVLKDYGMDIDPRTKARKLSLVERRKLNIVRALFSDAKLVILDEPTTSLRKEDRDNLFHFVKELSHKGVSFIFISHYLDEVIDLCGKIVVFRDGYAKCMNREVNELGLSEAIIGQGVELYHRQCREKECQRGLTCTDLHAEGVNGASFTLPYGKIMGFVGFPGSGAREVMRALGGLVPIKGGAIAEEGQKPVTICNPKDARKRGIMYVPFDRHEEGLVQEMSILNNIGLCRMDDRTISNRLGFIRKRVEIKNTMTYYDELQIKARNPQEVVRTLSGGNQQKVLIAKVLCCNPKVMLLDEPTIGIDIGSREEILSLVDHLAQGGMAVVYHTSDYSEMLRICDSIYFFHGGRFVKKVSNKGLSIQEVTDIRDSLKGTLGNGC